jgi:hypothetical protein
LADDGSIDTTFNSAGIGANNTVRSALCNQTIKLLSLELSHLNGLLANRIARVLSTGMLDQAL